MKMRIIKLPVTSDIYKIIKCMASLKQPVMNIKI